MKFLCAFFTVILVLSSSFGVPVSAKNDGYTLESDAKSLILIEANTGAVLYEKDADMPLPPASVTKVMTMLLIMEAIDSGKIFMAKPNLRELENFTGQSVLGMKDVVEASKKYLDLGVENVLVSLGSDGAVLTDGRTSYYCKSANVAVNSTVGAGDCMVAAACVGLINGVDMPELIRMSVAAGTAAVTTSGTNLFYKDKYEEIYAKIFTQKI
jgi:D-alanyl-D-alanine carboxypeptidase